MSRGGARNGFAWAALARQSAERGGFEDVRCPLQGEAFSLPGELSPSVQVFFQRITFTEVAPFAFLGIYAEAFEREWRERLLRTDLQPEFEDTPFGLHSANVSGLSPRPWSPNSPSERDVAEVIDWFGRLFEYARRLPSSVNALATAVEANKIADHNVEAYLGHPVKTRGFVQWLHRTYDVDLSKQIYPLLSDRTEPYDVKTMLN